MTESERIERNTLMLHQCYPVFRDKIVQVLQGMESLKYRPRIQCAWRSPADEIIAYNEGHSHVRFGFHNVTNATTNIPEALAVDVLDDDNPLNAPTSYYVALAKEANKVGLETGIVFGLPENIQERLEVVIKTDSTWSGPIGWDPSHVQVSVISIEQAESGVRPA